MSQGQNLALLRSFQNSGNLNLSQIQQKLAYINHTRSKISSQLVNLTKDYDRKIKELQQKLEESISKNQSLIRQNNLYQKDIEGFEARLIQKQYLIAMLIGQQGQKFRTQSNRDRGNDKKGYTNFLPSNITQRVNEPPIKPKDTQQTKDQKDKYQDLAAEPQIKAIDKSEIINKLPEVKPSKKIQSVTEITQQTHQKTIQKIIDVQNQSLSVQNNISQKESINKINVSLARTVPPPPKKTKTSFPPPPKIRRFEDRQPELASSEEQIASPFQSMEKQVVVITKLQQEESFSNNFFNQLANENNHEQKAQFLQQNHYNHNEKNINQNKYEHEHEHEHQNFQIQDLQAPPKRVKIQPKKNKKIPKPITQAAFYEEASNSYSQDQQNEQISQNYNNIAVQEPYKQKASTEEFFAQFGQQDQYPEQDRSASERKNQNILEAQQSSIDYADNNSVISSTAGNMLDSQFIPQGQSEPSNQPKKMTKKNQNKRQVKTIDPNSFM